MFVAPASIPLFRSPHSGPYLPSLGSAVWRTRGPAWHGSGVLARAEDKARGSPSSGQQQSYLNSDKLQVGNFDFAIFLEAMKNVIDFCNPMYVRC